MGTPTLIISNKEMGDIMNVVKSLEESGLSIKCTKETIENETKKLKRWISWHAIRYIKH